MQELRGEEYKCQQETTPSSLSHPGTTITDLKLAGSDSVTFPTWPQLPVSYRGRNLLQFGECKNKLAAALLL